MNDRADADQPHVRLEQVDPRRTSTSFQCLSSTDNSDNNNVPSSSSSFSPIMMSDDNCDWTPNTMEHIASLEQSFCSYFKCCNIEFPDFHAFVEHREEEHIGVSSRTWKLLRSGGTGTTPRALSSLSHPPSESSTSPSSSSSTLPSSPSSSSSTSSPSTPPSSSSTLPTSPSPTKSYYYTPFNPLLSSDSSAYYPELSLTQELDHAGTCAYGYDVGLGLDFYAGGFVGESEDVEMAVAGMGMDDSTSSDTATTTETEDEQVFLVRVRRSKKERERGGERRRRRDRKKGLVELERELATGRKRTKSRKSLDGRRVPVMGVLSSSFEDRDCKDDSEIEGRKVSVSRTKRWPSSSSSSTSPSSTSTSTSSTSTSILTPAPTRNPQPKTSNSKKERAKFRCPNAGCTKAYLNPGGLKYHLEKGTCTCIGTGDSTASSPSVADTPAPTSASLLHDEATSVHGTAEDHSLCRGEGEEGTNTSSKPPRTTPHIQDPSSSSSQTRCSPTGPARHYYYLNHPHHITPSTQQQQQLFRNAQVYTYPNINTSTVNSSGAGAVLSRVQGANSGGHIYASIPTPTKTTTTTAAPAL